MCACGDGSIDATSSWKDTISVCMVHHFSLFCYQITHIIRFLTEGTGQNFLDEVNQSALNFESRAKRLKIAVGDGLHQNQVMCRTELCFASVFMSKKLLVLFLIQVPVLSDCAFQGMPYIRLFSHQIILFVENN